MRSRIARIVDKFVDEMWTANVDSVDGSVEKVVDKRPSPYAHKLRIMPGRRRGGCERLSEQAPSSVAIEFIAFCFTRRAVSWPQLYDEMCFVAGNRLFQGLGYAELTDAGLDFTLAGLARTSRLANEVTSRMRSPVPAA